MCPNCENKLPLKKLLLIISILALGVLGIDSYASDKHDHSKMSDSSTNRKPLTEKTKKSVISVLEANESLHGSFFKYDGKEVEKSAIQLKKAIEAIEDKDIAKLLVFSKEKLSEIKASNDREVNNQNYHLVSMALIHIINKYDVGSKYNAYSCPMVKKKWVQNSSKMENVHNPYAPSMPHCGSQDSNH